MCTASVQHSLLGGMKDLLQVVQPAQRMWIRDLVSLTHRGIVTRWELGKTRQDLEEAGEPGRRDDAAAAAAAAAAGARIILVSMQV